MLLARPRAADAARAHALFQELRVAGCGLQDLEGLCALQRLRALHAARNRVSDLAPLAGATAAPAGLNPARRMRTGAMQPCGVPCGPHAAHTASPWHACCVHVPLPAGCSCASRLPVPMHAGLPSLELLDLEENAVADIDMLIYLSGALSRLICRITCLNIL